MRLRRRRGRALASSGGWPRGKDIFEDYVRFGRYNMGLGDLSEDSGGIDDSMGRYTRVDCGMQETAFLGCAVFASIHSMTD